MLETNFRCVKLSAMTDSQELFLCSMLVKKIRNRHNFVLTHNNSFDIQYHISISQFSHGREVSEFVADVDHHHFVITEYFLRSFGLKIL